MWGGAKFPKINWRGHRINKVRKHWSSQSVKQVSQPFFSCVSIKTTNTHIHTDKYIYVCEWILYVVREMYGGYRVLSVSGCGKRSGRRRRLFSRKYFHRIRLCVLLWKGGNRRFIKGGQEDAVVKPYSDIRAVRTRTYSWQVVVVRVCLCVCEKIREQNRVSGKCFWKRRIRNRSTDIIGWYGYLQWTQQDNISSGFR